MLKQVSDIFFLLLSCYLGVESQDSKDLTNELEVNVAASKAWMLYRHLEIAMIAARELKNIIQLQVLEYDGGVGTAIKLNFVQGNSSTTERFIEIDDQKRVKVVKGLEGRCLANGCSVIYFRVEIIEKTDESCVIKSKISYAVKKEFEAHDPKPDIRYLAAIGQCTKRFLESTQNA